MWNLNQLISGGDEEQQDNLLGDTEGLCSLSPLQVEPSELYPKSTPISKKFSFFFSFGLNSFIAILDEQRIYGFAACLLAGLVLMFLV